MDIDAEKTLETIYDVLEVLGEVFAFFAKAMKWINDTLISKFPSVVGFLEKIVGWIGGIDFSNLGGLFGG